MADLQYSVGVNTSQATAALTSLQSKIGGLSAGFSKLQGVMAGLAVGAIIQNVLKYSDAINDLKDSTGIATANIIGFTQAVSYNGGSTEAASTALQKLVNSIGEAADGSAAAQDAFGQVGVTLKDLATLSEQDILAKTVSGLANITDKSARAVVQAQLLGKAFRAVNIEAVAATYASATAGATEYARNVEKADQIQTKLEHSMEQFRQSVLKTLAPLADFLGKLDQKKIDEAVDAVVKLTAAIVGLSATLRVLELVGSVVTAIGSAFVLFKTGAAVVRIGLSSIATAAGSIGSVFRGIGVAVTEFRVALTTVTTVGGRFAAYIVTMGPLLLRIITALTEMRAAIAVVAVGLAYMAPYILAIIATLTALHLVLKNVFKIDLIDTFTASVGRAYDKFKAFLGLKSGTVETPTTPALVNDSSGRDKGAGVIAAQQPDARNKYEAEQKAKRDKILRDVKAAYDAQIATIRQTAEAFRASNKDTLDSIRLQGNLIGKSKDYVDVLNAQTELHKRSADSIRALREEKSKLTAEQLRANLGAEYDKQIALIESLTAAEDKELKKAIEAANAKETKNNLVLYGIQQQIDLQNKLQSIQDNIAMSTMPELEKRYEAIKIAARDSAKAAIEAEAARIGRPLNADETKAYYDAALKGAQDLKNVTKDEYDNSRSFATGWKQAFNDYVESATDSAQRAKDAFTNVTKGMEDLIVNFAQTGKFEFKNFLSSIVEMMLRSDIQKMMAGLFSGGDVKGGGSGGIFSGIAKMLGFANGGIIPTNNPVLVGERGPEIISGAAGRSVTPNSALGGTNVTYNIQAVDARSFQQMLAQQPELLYALTMKGSPTGGR